MAVNLILRPTYSDDAVNCFNSINSGMLLRVSRSTGVGILVEGMSSSGLRRFSVAVPAPVVAEVTEVPTPLTRTQGRFFFWYSLPTTPSATTSQAAEFIEDTDAEV